MAFNTAISGLNAASTDLDVIGNNVANAGTTGFKSSRVEFADIFPASSLGTAANAVGRGVNIAAVTQQFAQGNVTFTDNNLDLAISGQGFFVLSDSGSQVFSRAGAFQADRDGFVVNSQGQRLQVYQADPLGNITGALGDLFLDRSDIAPSATTAVDVVANLNANAADVSATLFDRTDAATYNNSTSLTLYDSLGNPLLMTMYYRHVGANSWEVHSWLTNPAGTSIEVIPAGGAAGTPATLTFASDGSLTAVNPPIGAGLLAIDYDPVTAAALATGAADLIVDIDYAGTTQFGSAFGVNSLTQDGYSSGRLRSIDVSDTGVVLARYTNGQSRTLAQVALANFNNPQGLRQLGNTAWTESFESGPALIGGPGTSSLGLINSGALEDSNVNLTEQLVDMIIAQRNFQANAQVIQTEDAITQTIINIR